MNIGSFLDTAETRATHLRELSNSLRALGWTNAVRRDIDREVPEIEVAVAVYRRLSTEGYKPDDGLGAWEFLAEADTRVEHLRQASHHMRSLGWVHASLIEVDHEIPDLELAISVYRRMSAEADARLGRPAVESPAATATQRPASDDLSGPDPAPVDPLSPAADPEIDSPPASGFKRFVMTHRDPAAVETAGADQSLDTASSPSTNGTL